VPADIQHLVDVQDENRLRVLVTESVDNQLASDKKKMQLEIQELEGRSLP
jgi:hypothetical protein